MTTKEEWKKRGIVLIALTLFILILLFSLENFTATGNVVNQEGVQLQEKTNVTGFEVLQTEAQNSTLRPTQIFFAVLAILLGITILTVTYTKQGAIPAFQIQDIVEKIKEKQTKKETEQQTEQQIQERKEEQKDELRNYIETQINKGCLITDIHETLIQTGWNQAQVDEAIHHVFAKMKK